MKIFVLALAALSMVSGGDDDVPARLLFRIEPPPGAVSFGMTTFVGDVDADGVSDIAVTSSMGVAEAYVSLYAGNSGREIRALQIPLVALADQYLPVSVARADDLDADGCDDLMIGGEAWVRAIHSTTGRVLWMFHADGPLPEYHSQRTPAIVRVHAVGDLDDDGVGDIVAVDSDRAAICAVSGCSGTLRWQIPLPSPAQVVAIDDVDSDGVRDFAVWRRDARLYKKAKLSPPSRPAPYPIEVFSGRVGIKLYDIAVPFGTSHAWAELGSVGDVDADGVADLCYWTVGLKRHHVVVVSGRDGRWVLDWTDGGGLHGRAIGAVGDLDRDGHADIGVSDGWSTVSFRSGADGSELWRIHEPHEYGDDFMRGYGWLQLGLHDRASDAHADFVISSMNMFDENWVDVFAVE